MTGIKEGQHNKNLNKRNNNYEDKVNEDDNEFPGLRLCVGVLGCHYGAGPIRYRAIGTGPAGLQCGHAKGLVSVEPGTGTQTSVGTWYRKPLWKASASTEMVQRSMNSAL